LGISNHIALKFLSLTIMQFSQFTYTRVVRSVSVSPVTDASCQFGDCRHQKNKVSRRWAPTSDIDSVSFVESLSDSDDQRYVLFIAVCNIYLYFLFATWAAWNR